MPLARFSRGLMAGASIVALGLLTPSFAERAVAGGALPSGGHYVAGTGAIAGLNGSLVVKQSTTTGIIDWNSFSIAKNNTVMFENGSGATLNEVTGGNLSTIAGSLHASGSLYLINQSGIIVSGTGKIVTGGNFVASTGSLDGTQRGNILDTGTIRSAHGNVGLSAANVSVPGSIAVVRGGQVWLMSSGTTSVSGALSAQAKNGSGGAIVVRGNDIAMSGSANASAAAAGGNGGVVSIVAKNSDQVTGSIDAVGGVHGQGGAIETSGHILSITGSKIDAGSGGHWLLDPYDLTIDNGAAFSINSSLGAGTSVTLETTATGTSGPGNPNPSGNGDIFIDSAISWGTAATLTMSAYRNINIEAPIMASGAGNVVLVTNTGGGSGDYNFDLRPTGFMGSLSFTGGSTSGASLTINGTPYTLIYSMDALQNINASNTALAGDYALATSLNASSVSGWIPIGTNGSGGFSNSDHGFTGSFEGLGNTISSLMINMPSVSFVGLFGDSSGTIRDIGMVGGSVTGETNFGALVAFNNNGSVVSDSFATTTVNGGGSGVLIGDNNGTITNSYAKGVVNGGSGGFDNGGLAAQSDGTIINCYATGAVNGGANSTNLGGLVGYNSGTVTDSYATGAVKGGGGSSNIGGLVGFEDGVISFSYATGTVNGGSGSSAVGGLIGISSYSPTTTNSYATGAVSGVDSVGGLIGSMIASGAANSFATGAVNGTEYVGGFVGYSNGDYGSPLANVYATGSVTGGAGSSYIGGLAGNYTNDNINNAFALGAVRSPGQYVGGFIGYINPATITNGYWDTQTTGLLSGIGGGYPSGGVAGESTAQLQSALPSGFGNTVWGTGPNLFPYLLWQFPNGTPQSVSGALIPDGSAEASPNINILINGTAVVPALSLTSTANDTYYELIAPNSIASNSAVLAYTGGTNAAASVEYASGSPNNLNIWAGSLVAPTHATSYSGASGTSLQTQDASLIAQAVGSNSAAQSLIAGLTNYGYIATGSGFAINAPVNLPGGLFVETTANGANIRIGYTITAPNATIALFSSGEILQDSSAAVTAEVLMGSSSGETELAAANAINLLGSFTTINAILMLTNDNPLSVTEPVNTGTGELILKTTGSGNELALEAPLSAKIVELVSSGDIASDSAAIIAADELKGSSVGSASLIADNQISILDGFTTANGDFSLTNSDAAPLAIRAEINSGTGNLTLNADGELAIQSTISGATVDLTSNDSSVSETNGGAVIADMLTGRSGAAVNLDATNAVAELGNFTSYIHGFTLADSTSLTVRGEIYNDTVDLTTIGAGHNLTINGPLDADYIYLESAGTISQSSAGIITTWGLQGASVGDTILNAANAIGSGSRFNNYASGVGGFTTANGDFALTNALSLTAGRVNAGAGTVTLTATGAGNFLIVMGATGSEVTLVSAGRLSGENIIAQTVTGSSDGEAFLYGTFGALAGFTTGNGNFQAGSNGPLTVTDAVDAGTGSLTLITGGSGNALTLEAALTGSSVDLMSSGTIGETSAGTISAPVLTGSSSGAVTLNASNTATILGAFATDNGNFSLNTTNSLNVTQPVNAGTGDLSLTTGANDNLVIQAAMTGNTVNLISGGEVEESASGAVTANLLNVTANTGILLTSTENNIQAIGTDTTNSGPNEIDQN